MSVPLKSDNLDMVAAQLAASILRGRGTPEDPVRDRVKMAVDTFHHVRDALVQSELDRGHRALLNGASVANANRAAAPRAGRTAGFAG